MTKKLQLVKLEQYDSDAYKYVVLGDKETNGDKFAFASLVLKDQEIEKNNYLNY